MLAREKRPCGLSSAFVAMPPRLAQRPPQLRFHLTRLCIRRAICVGIAVSVALCCGSSRAFFPKLGQPDIKGRIFLITGSTDGIGLHTAEKLGGIEGTVLIHGRSEVKVDESVWKLQSGWEANATGFAVDFASMDEVRLFGNYLAETYPVIDGLALNAGIYRGGDAIRESTEDGDEYTFCVNVMAPFLLASILLPCVWRAKQGRLLVTTADLEECEHAHIYLNDLQLQQNWTPKNAYYLSKVCNAMIAQELHERYGDVPNFTVNQFDPGQINTKVRLGGWGPNGNPIAFANDMFNLLINPKWSETSGKYFKPSLIAPEESEVPKVLTDAEKRRELWETLERMTEAKWPDPPGAELALPVEATASNGDP